LLDLILQSLLVFLVLLLVLATNDLLGLLGDSVELDILGSLNQVFNQKGESLHLSLDLFELGLGVEDLVQVLDFLVSSVLDLRVLKVNVLAIDQNGILVVGGNRQLRHLNLTLLEIDDNLKVELEFLLSLAGLLQLLLDLGEFFKELILLIVTE
jgi:hypothetical protein